MLQNYVVQIKDLRKLGTGCDCLLVHPEKARLEHVLGSDGVTDIDEKVNKNEAYRQRGYPANEMEQLNHG
jgi:hypothetical protein